MANNALKTTLKTDLIELIRGNIAESSNYYLFVSRASPYTDVAATTSVLESDTNPPSLGESSRNVYDTFRNILFIKRIRPDNMRLIVPRVDWESGQVYTAYTETTDMAGEPFYVMTTDYNVYKCMGSNGSSDIMPTGKSSHVVTLSDGYSWKYLYTIPEDFLSFVTLEYIPVYLADERFPEQKQVQTTAQPGSIDSVSINPSLSPTFDKIYRTDRFITNNNTDMQTQLGFQANLAGTTHISFNTTGEQDDPAVGFWNDYAIHITSGAGIGQYFRIVNFKKGGVGNSYFYADVYPAISRDLVAVADSNPTDATKFKIVPYVVVDGDGDDAIVVPTTSNAKKITGLSIVNSGSQYTYAQPRVVTENANISIGSAVGLLNASMSSSLSTPLGHGSSAIREFGSANLMMVVEIEDNENGKLSVRNDYRQFGILKSPYLFGGETYAGSEEDVALKALVKKQPSKDDLYDAETFIIGNSVIGKETHATARILNSESIPGSRFHRLYLTDVVGNFRFANDASLFSRVYFDDTFVGTLATGDNAFQYTGTVGVTLSAAGIVISYDLTEGDLLLDTTFGAFATGKSIYFTAGSTLQSSSILDVDEDLGELLGQVTFGATSGSEFLTFGGDEIFGRMGSTSLVPVVVEDVGEYRLTTKVTLVSSGSPYNDGVVMGSAALDGTLTQTNSTTLKKVTGTVIDFTVAGGLGLTGIVHLSNVTGTFNTSNALVFTPYGTTADANITSTTINTIENSEVTIGSGELLYIENVRPISRNLEQFEEFKIVIGF